MKIGIIGSGMVGGAIANALVHSGVHADIVLNDKEPSIAEAQALDINSGSLERALVRAGELGDLRGASVIVFAAGKRVQGGLDTKGLLDMNAEVLERNLPGLLETAPDAIVINAVHPMNLMTGRAVKLCGTDKAARVIGSGTMLETNLLRQALGAHLGVHPRHIHGYALGEEGGSALVAWSSVRVAGMNLEEFLAGRGTTMHFQQKSQITDRVQQAVASAAKTKGAFLFGVGASVAQLVTAILNDSHEVLTVSAWDPKANCVISMPRIIGRGGVLESLEPSLNDDERARLKVIEEYSRHALE